ncbi:STAS domain-containing protein [Streptomyces sp. NPDC050560]|uniref:STAS domain-containing protein n=1 Tax=Streptomyces sp. NPDC050560 TaxID=3365630 RepID=UPI0037AF885F
MMTEPHVHVSVQDGVRIVRLSGEFDADAAELLERNVGAPEPGSVLGVVVDLSDVSFADSSFLHVLLGARRLHDALGVPFVLTAPSDAPQRLLEMTDTARAFTIAPGLDAASDLARARHGEAAG